MITRDNYGEEHIRDFQEFARKYYNLYTDPKTSERNIGGSADPLLNGFDFVDSHPDVVFVSFNYRLGIFGFIDFSDVTGRMCFGHRVYHRHSK